MATRAATFTARIRNLHDYQLRLLHNIMPVPSGVDIANTLKYFSQTLLTVLKDVPSSPMEMLKSQEKDSVRLGLYPILDYKGLYNAIVQLTDVVPLIQYGLNVFGQAMLQCLGCLLPFLDHDMIDTLPYMTASLVAVLPSALHQEIVNSLCFYILPFTITRRDADDDDEQENYASQSVAAIIMMVFQYSEDPAHHCQLLECLMTNKKNVVKDLLCVIAYGTSGARASAAKLLFYYWPTFNPNLFDRRVVLQKFTNLVPFVCQNDMCPNAGNAEAAKVCYDHCISITFASDSPPPLYLCIECANEIHREHPNQMFFDILHPMQQVSMTCENKNCRASDKYAVSICFSTECASYNGNHPIRYCQQCHNIRHNNRRGGDHIVHTSLPQLWDMDAEVQTYMVESIVSLLKEAKSLNSDTNKDLADIHSKASLLNVLTTVDPISLEERQLLGRYGVWLLVGLCTPHEDTPAEILGRLLSVLFLWFDITSYTFDDQENTLERLKTEFVCGWLSDVCSSHFKVFVSCLLPHPPDYARVGGHWDTLVSRTSHLKEGLTRLFSLVPYEIITSEIWDYVMPHWMEAMVNDVPEKEQQELKNLLSKILDPDMSPLGFDAKKLYHFVTVRFKKTSARVQEQALNWLQILTALDIVIPLPQLFAMFNDGVRVMKGNSKDEKPSKTHKHEESGRRGSPVKDMDDMSPSPVREDSSGNTSGLSDDEAPTSRHVEFETDAELTLSCCILMLDVLLRQMEIQNVEKHNGVHTSLSEDVSQLLKLMISASWVGSHSCASKNDCVFCESCVMWHQLALQLVEFLAPDRPVNPPDSHTEEQGGEGGGHGCKSPPESEKKPEPKPDVVINMPIPEFHSVGVVLMHVPHIMTATVETVTEQLDLAPIIPAEKVVAAVARAVTITDTDVATATAQVARPTLVGENDQPIDPVPEEDLDDFWHTSVGKFRFSVDELPQHLQLIHELLKELPNVEEPDILYYMLQCLHILCLHGDALTKASKEHLGFLIWCQENLLIKNLWDMCNSEHSHICQVCVPLLLHCITLPSGSDVFWKVIQEEFHSTDWRVRFVAVERVTVIARFMDSTPLRSNLPLQAALANAFCYLISSMDDINVHVAQRATLYLGTIHDNAIKSLIMSLETQFDSVIVDRPMVLQSLYQLHNCLSDRKILTWEFFLNRFDALFLEAQINLEKSGDIAYLRDLRNTDLNSEVFIRKLHRAHEALSQQSDGSGSSGVKTLSASFGPKWPYKRTMSAPASIVPRQDTKQEKEKVYNRQYSAPILKRKSSRFGLGQFLGSIPSNNSVPDGHIHSLNAGSTGDDGNIIGFVRHIIDLEEADKETMHLLVFLLMQFLSRSDQAYLSDEKSMAKTQTIVLRHLYLLLGYNQNERGFYIPPQQLRTSPVFNVFLANLPQLLDQNHLMGWVLLPTCVVLLQYCPCPHHSPSVECQTPTYSLWYLEPHTRRCWLMSLLVLLYKYQYNQQPHSSQMQSLVKIVLNTLDAQYHQCRRIPATLVMGVPPTHSRDVSQPSLGGDAEHSGGGGGSGAADRLETPPLTPLYTVDGSSHVSVSSKAGKMQATYYQKSSVGSGMEIHWEETAQPEAKAKPHLDRKMPESSCSIEADETESELAAIPESPKSDSTLHGSTRGSFEELVDMNEACSLLTTEEHVTAHTRPVTVNSEAANVAMHEPPRMVVLENRPQVVDAHAVQQMKAGSGPEPPSSHRRPVWFLGSEEETLQTSESSGEKWGVKEGVKMLMTSSLLSVSQPHTQRALTVTQNSTDTGSPTSTSSSTSRISASAVASSIAAVAVARTVGKDTHAAVQSTPQQERPPEMWPDNPQHGSPVPRALGRQKHLLESSVTPLPTPASYSGSHAHAQHLPWQLQQQPQLATPSVERLLPIGTTRLGSPIELDSENNASEVTSTCSITQLELPVPERLLPIGSHSKESIPCLVEKVRQALGVPTGVECAAEQAAERQRPIYLDAQSHMPFVKQGSFEKPDVQLASSTPQREDVYPSRGVSPRRLIKQAALDSPPPQLQGDTDESHTSFYRTVHYDRKPAPVPQGKTEDHARTQRHRPRKAGLFSTGPQSLADYPRRPGSWCGPRTLLDPETQQACHAEFDLKQSSFRIGDECVYERCSECGTVKEEYSDEELGLCIIILGTFIHREPALAAPILPEILSIVATVALSASYPWQCETNIYLPGGATSVAHQFLRCVLHQLAPNGIFVQMFQTHADDTTRMQFFRSVAQALLDFNELNPIAPLQLLLEGLNSKKSLPVEMLSLVLPNMACYLDCLPLETGLGPGSTTWSALLTQLEIFFRRLVFLVSTIEDVEPLLRIMVSVLKVPGISAYKAILDPFSKVLGFSIENRVMKYHYLVDLCYLCNRGFTREREKLILTRMVVFELVQVLKFKTSIPDSNFLMLINFVLQDAGGSLPLNVMMEDSPPLFSDIGPLFNTSASECMRQHLADALEFLADFHTLSKLKSYCKGMTVGLNEDTLGGVLKCGIAQYLALEITRGNKDNRTVARYLPWLYNAPSALQQGPREFIDCVGHIRLMSWLLLGSLMHTALHGGLSHATHSTSHCHCQPLPQEASCHIADHIQVIMAGFAEQSKASVLHMSSLFHGFILCQLWTVYLEQGASSNLPSSEAHSTAMSILIDFWGKVTPSILQLVSHSKVLAEMVNLHFLSLLEALLECNSTVLSKLLPIWTPVLFSYHVQLPGHLQVRLQACRNFPPTTPSPIPPGNQQQAVSNPVLLRWLQRLQFKMGQIELQSSAATQFYSV